MRILFSFVGGSGHFLPLVPIAYAAKNAAHTVIFAAHASMRSSVQAQGFDCLSFGVVNNDKPEKMPLLAVDMQHEEDVLREHFVRKAGRTRAKEIISICSTWKPDIIVCDEVDFGAMIAAEYLGIPHVPVIVIASGSFIRPDVVAETLNEIRAEFGLALDPTLQMLSCYLVLSPVPPGYRDPAFPYPATTHFIQPAMPASEAENNIPFINGQKDVPIVYFTLGTVFNLESGDLFSRVIAGLRDLPIKLIVTVGQHIEPEEFGVQPDNVFIAQYIPQAKILSHCDLVVSHAGSGSVIATLAHALPMLLIPMGADQPLNAARCESLGVAKVLDAIEASPEMIRDAASQILNADSYRLAAKSIQDEIAAMPPVSSAVELLEQVGKTKQPIFSP